MHCVKSRPHTTRDGAFARWVLVLASLLFARVLLFAPAAADDSVSAGVSLHGAALPPTMPGPQAAPLAQGTFLVANPGMVDGNFAESVVLLLEHGADGAMGLIVNRPTQATLTRLLPDVGWLEGRPEVVFQGGPVGLEQVFILVRTASAPTPAEHVVSDIYATGSEEVLQALIERADPKEMFRVYAGYSGWAPGQLEGEIARGGWRLAPGDSSIVFEVPSRDVWPELIQRTSGDWVGPVPGPTLFSVNRSSLGHGQSVIIRGLQ